VLEVVPLIVVKPLMITTLVLEFPISVVVAVVTLEGAVTALDMDTEVVKAEKALCVVVTSGVTN